MRPPSAWMSGTERPTTKTPSAKNPERNGLEKAENSTATEVTTMTFTYSSHSAFHIGASKADPCIASVPASTSPITPSCTARVSNMPSHLPSTNSHR